MTAIGELGRACPTTSRPNWQASGAVDIEDVPVRVPTSAAFSARRRWEDTDLLVVADGALRHPGRFGQLADAHQAPVVRLGGTGDWRQRSRRSQT